jgi:tripartite-type tricarboxylate transporter receptor subunit TctC
VKKSVIALLFGVLPLLAACGAQSDGGDPTGGVHYPDNCRTVQIIVTFSAGGASDTNFRLLAEYFKDEFPGTDFQVVNVPGGGGATGINQLLNSPADGCTIGHTSIPSHLAYLLPDSPATYTKSDLQFAGGFGLEPQLLVVAADSPYRTFQDLVDAGRTTGYLNAVADSPTGTDAIINVQFADASGIKLRQTVVDGSAEKVAALLSGQVDFANGAIGGVLPSVQSGQLRALAVWSEERASTLPDVPTATELGIPTVVEVRFGVIMSNKVSAEVRQTLETALHDITQKPDFIQTMASYGNDTVFLTGSEFSVVWDEMGQTLTGLDFSSLG